MIKKLFFKAAIFIAVFFPFINVAAQEYNNWMLSDGVFLNFETSPATINCNKKSDNNLRNHTVALSDNRGKLLIYGYLEELDNSTAKKYFVIRNSQNEILTSFRCSEVTNAVGCKLFNGEYCIAAVLRLALRRRELHIYMFDKDGNFKDEYVYNEGNYSFFIDFIQCDDFIALIAYRSGQIETYKLTSQGSFLLQKVEKELDFSLTEIVSFDIEQSLYGKIICTTYDIAYIIDFDKKSGQIINISDKYETNKFRTMAFSKNDQYFLIIDDNKLKVFKYEGNFNFDFENPAIVYDISEDVNTGCNHCWDMAIGNDGKLYIHHQYADYIIVLDGIESGNITEKRITSECLTYTHFPHIPRIEMSSVCNVSASFGNAAVCYGDELKISLSGNAPFEIFYTLNDGEEKSFKTERTEFLIDNVPGKYKITKIKDLLCEFSPTENNEAEIFKAVKTPKIIEDN